MSGLAWVVAMVAVVAVVCASAWWVCREGLRQGDEPGDAVTAAALRTGPDGTLTVSVSVTNPGTSPVVASARTRWVARLWPLTGVGRTTRRRAPAGLDGRLLAIDAHDSRSVAWSLARPAGRQRLLVDVHIWQQAGRLRRQRHVLAAQARPTAAPPVGEPVR
jgi:hypothetical protein